MLLDAKTLLLLISTAPRLVHPPPGDAGEQRGYGTLLVSWLMYGGPLPPPIKSPERKSDVRSNKPRRIKGMLPTV
eukprot:1152628-Pelagomonas_calceolata.AAC.1